MQEVWKVAVGIAGVGAIGAFVLWSVYKQWLTLDIFQKMTKRQQFILFILLLSFTFAFAVIALVVYVIVNFGNTTKPDDTTTSYVVELKYNGMLSCPTDGGHGATKFMPRG